MSPFHTGTHMQYAWDSTSLGWFKSCPRKYYYHMIEQWNSPEMGPNLSFGIFYHSALEEYDHARAEGLNHDESVFRATFRALKDSFGWESDHTYKNRFNLIRSVIWYCEHFKDDPAKTIILESGKPAVELSFRLQVDDDLILCGHLDRVVEFQESFYVMDRKTSSSTISSYYFEGYAPDNQMSLYTLASQIIYKTPVKGVIIDAAQIAVGFTRFERGFTYRTKTQLDEWLDETRLWVKQAHVCAESNHWPMNDKSCHQYGGCEFRRICSKSPEVRDRFLESDFKKREWNPLVPR